MASVDGSGVLVAVSGFDGVSVDELDVIGKMVLLRRGCFLRSFYIVSVLEIYHVSKSLWAGL